MTNDPSDLKVRVNMDLAAMIPTGSRHQKAARDFAYLYQPSVIDAYNASQLGFAPTTDATMPTDPRIAGMIPYYTRAPSIRAPRCSCRRRSRSSTTSRRSRAASRHPEHDGRGLGARRLPRPAPSDTKGSEK
jgi:hypothetical protein